MAKYLKALLIMLALTVVLAGVSSAASPKACLTFIHEPVPEIVSQEAACSCYYGDGGYGFGTLYIPNWYTRLGIDYTCNSLPPALPDGFGDKTMKFTLSSNGAIGNCVEQHSGAPKAAYPNFYYGVNGSAFFMQIGVRNASGDIIGWDCAEGLTGNRNHIWSKTSGGGGDGYPYVEFQITYGGANLVLTGAAPAYANPFLAGTPVRLATTCTASADAPNNIPIDDCTLCTNCSSVTITRSGTSSCQSSPNFDPPTDCPNQDGKSVPPWTIFRSQNQFATTVVPGPGPIHGQFIGKLLFNGIVDIYYAPQNIAGEASKSRTGFTNNPQSWDVVDNYTDMGCFYFCSNTAQVCGDYCCYGPLFGGIDADRLITDAATFKFDIVATQKWDAGQNVVKAWVGDKLDGSEIAVGTVGATAFNKFFTLSATNLQTLGIDLTQNETASVGKPICVFAQTQDKTKAILTRSFTLDYARLELSDTKKGYWKTAPFMDGKFPILPPDNKRWMGAWRINGMQFAVGHAYTEPRYKTRCMFANKGDETVSVWFDMTSLMSCAVTGVDYYSCLENKINTNNNLSLGKVAPHSLKYVELDRQIYVYKGADGALDPDVIPNPIPLVNLSTLDRYSWTFLVGTDPTNQITNIGAAAGNAFHQAALVDPIEKEFNPGNWEIYSGTPIGPAYEAPVQIMCIQKDASGDWRSIPVNTGTWNANPWQN